MVRKAIGLAKVKGGFKIAFGTKTNPKLGRKIFKTRSALMIAVGRKKVVRKRRARNKARSSMSSGSSFSVKRLLG